MKRISDTAHQCYTSAMNFLDKLEKKFGWMAISNLTFYLIIAQGIGFLLITISPETYKLLSFTGAQIIDGEWWRSITYLMEPLTTNIIFLVFAMYLYYLYGTALERLWGSFHYTVYVFISLVASLLCAILFPMIQITNVYLFTSLFLAFAFLFPDFTLMIFFVLPVKVKWIAAVTWIITGASFVMGSTGEKILILFSLANFLFFFGDELLIIFRNIFQKQSSGVRSVVIKKKPNHVCVVCKKNEIDNPDMGIRYCNECIPESCYCEEHVQNHPHKSTGK